MKPVTFDSIIVDPEYRKLLVEESIIGILLVDLDGSIMDASLEFQSMSGYTKAELKKMTFQQITHPDDMLASMEVVNAMIEGRVCRVEFLKRYINKAGVPFWARVVSRLKRDDQGKPFHFVTFAMLVENQKLEELKLLWKHQEGKP
jgi:PAS domain S-box-containing protein